jgi:hypothetical protein
MITWAIKYHTTQRHNPQDMNQQQQFALYAKSRRSILIFVQVHILTTANKLLNLVLTASFHASHRQQTQLHDFLSFDLKQRIIPQGNSKINTRQLIPNLQLTYNSDNRVNETPMKLSKQWYRSLSPTPTKLYTSSRPSKMYGRQGKTRWRHSLVDHRLLQTLTLGKTHFNH